MVTTTTTGTTAGTPPPGPDDDDDSKPTPPPAGKTTPAGPATRAPVMTPIVPPAGGHAAPKRPDDYPNVEIHLMLGFKAPYIVRGDLRNETTWAPVFDPSFNSVAPSHAKDVLALAVAADIDSVCQDVIALTDSILPGQEAQCPGLAAGTLDWHGMNSHRAAGFYFGLQDPCSNPGVDNRVRWLSLPAMKSTIELKAGFETFTADWRKLDDLVASVSKKYPGTASLVVQSVDAANPFFTLAAVSGAKWGIGSSLAFSVLAVVLFTMDVRMTIIVMTSITMNVVSVMGVFNLIGWQLGAVEAVTLSILVGTSVDYLVHFVEAFASAPVPAHALQGPRTGTDTAAVLMRRARVETAVQSIGVPILSSAVTTIGSISMLLFASLVPLRRFGTVLILVTAFSLLVTMVLTPALLTIMGPPKFTVTPRRCGATVGLWSPCALLFLFVCCCGALLREGAPTALPCALELALARCRCPLSSSRGVWGGVCVCAIAWLVGSPPLVRPPVGKQTRWFARRAQVLTRGAWLCLAPNAYPPRHCRLPSSSAAFARRLRSWPSSPAPATRSTGRAGTPSSSVSGRTRLLPHTLAPSLTPPRT